MGLTWLLKALILFSDILLVWYVITRYLWPTLITYLLLNTQPGETRSIQIRVYRKIYFKMAFENINNRQYEISCGFVEKF